MATQVQGEIGTAIGGSKDAVIISHSHAFNGNQLPNHSHSSSIAQNRATRVTSLWNSNINNAWSGGLINYGTSSVSAGKPSGSISTEGSPGIDKNLPPYLKLAYIQRMS